MLIIRELKRDDNFEELIRLSRIFFEEYESHHVDFFKIDFLDCQHIINYFSRWIENEDGTTFIALEDGTIIGYITVYVQEQPDFWAVKQVGHISGLMVAPSHRRQGVAAMLYEASLAFFKEKKVRYFTVFTSVNNRDALRFYEKQKLKPIYTTLMGEI
jgi:ribosomal protein S18 acetylase RimI-like enzyme